MLPCPCRKNPLCGMKAGGGRDRDNIAFNGGEHFGVVGEPAGTSRFSNCLRTLRVRIARRN